MMRKQSQALVAFYSLLTITASCSNGGSPLDRARKERTAVIAAVQFAAPYIYQSQEDFQGPEADLGRKIGAKIGPDIRLVFGPRSFNMLVSSVVNGEAQAALGTLGITESRRQKIDFSDSYHALELSLLVNPSHRPFKSPTPREQLAGIKIGVREGTSVESFVLETLPDSILVPQTSLDSAVLALRRKEIDAVVDDRLMAAYSLDTVTGAGHLELLPEVLGKIPIAVGVPKDSPEMLQLVNQAVAEIKDVFSEELEKILEGRVEKVAQRYENRINQERQAREPRNISIRVSKDADYPLDIYKMANLQFTLSGGGQTYTSSRITFRGPVAYASLQAPPNDYSLRLREFGFQTVVSIVPTHASNVTINIRLKRSGPTLNLR